MRGEAGLQQVAAAASPIVVASALAPVQVARLKDALRDHGHLHLTRTFAELASLLRTTVEPIDAVVVGVRDSAGGDAVTTVRHIASTRPQTAILVYAQTGPEQSTQLRSLVMAGADGFFFYGIGDTGIAMRAALQLARRQCAVDCLMARLISVIPATLQPMAEAALARPDVITTVPSLAAALSVHRKTLFNRCAEAEFLPPGELLAWTRLALVGYLLDTTGCTIEAIAIELGYPSDTALRNSAKRYTGRRATDLRRLGAVECIVGALSRRVNNHRAGDRALHLV